jgi:hypothetical protein
VPSEVADETLPVCPEFWLTVHAEQSWWWALNVVPEEAKPGDWLTPDIAQGWLSAGNDHSYGYVI